MLTYAAPAPDSAAGSLFWIYRRGAPGVIGAGFGGEGQAHPSRASEGVAEPIEEQVTLPSMDAKQVWRATLGELQVTLSPANYETWLKDTALVDVEGDRFRVAAPNGFAKDWLENRYKSLIAQTLARVVGYSVNVEFEVREGPLVA